MELLNADGSYSESLWQRRSMSGCVDRVRLEPDAAEIDIETDAGVKRLEPARAEWLPLHVQSVHGRGDEHQSSVTRRRW